jgi:hypothetical protein
MQINDQRYKWASSTYIGKETRITGKLFRSYSVRAAFKTTNTSEELLCLKRPSLTNTDEWDTESKHTHPMSHTSVCNILTRVENYAAPRRLSILIMIHTVTPSTF